MVQFLGKMPIAEEYGKNVKKGSSDVSDSSQEVWKNLAMSNSLINVKKKNSLLMFVILGMQKNIDDKIRLVK